MLEQFLAAVGKCPDADARRALKVRFPLWLSKWRGRESTVLSDLQVLHLVHRLVGICIDEKASLCCKQSCGACCLAYNDSGE